MLQLVSLIKREDVDRFGGGPDPAGARAGEPARGCPVPCGLPVDLGLRPGWGATGPATAGLSAAAGPASAGLSVAAGPASAGLSVAAGPASAGLPVAGGLDDDMSDAGMSTVEYAVGTVAAAAFAAVLYQIVTGGSVLAGLTDLINRAMSVF